VKINWGTGSAFNMGTIEGTDYKCERFWVPNNDQKEHWFLLSKPTGKHYLCTKGPFNSPEERDMGIIKEVRKRELADNS
jgi:hypothetical protein